MLTTVHSAKGLEWDAVFLAGMEDGVLPLANADDIEEERRIAYVGVSALQGTTAIPLTAEICGPTLGDHAKRLGHPRNSFL